MAGVRPRLKPLHRQTIVITGGSSGIGLATALRAASRGAAVVLASRNEAALKAACRSIEAAGGRAAYAVADVGVEADVQTIVDVAQSAFGGFDTWVNNAGVAVYSTLMEMPTDEHERLFRTNYWGVVFGSRAAVRHLRHRPGGGALITVGSINSDFSIPLLSAYSASKHAAKGFAEALRLELMHAGTPVSVSLIKPSGIATALPQHARNHMSAEPRIPPPLYAPEVVADAILHAAEHEVRDITVGSAGRIIAGSVAIAPSIADRVLARLAPPLQKSRHPLTATDNLFAPVREEQVHSPYASGRRFSAYTSARKNPGAAAGVAAVAALLAWRLLNGRSRRP